MNEAESYAFGMELERDSVIAECKQMQKDLDAESKLADALADALAEVFALIEDGTLVRGIDGDHHPDYVHRALRLVTALKRAQDALRTAGRLP